MWVRSECNALTLNKTFNTRGLVSIIVACGTYLINFPFLLSSSQQQALSTMADSQTTHVDHPKAAAVSDLEGRVLPNGLFQCTRKDRLNRPLYHECGAKMKNKIKNIRCHLSKLHNPNAQYAAAKDSPWLCNRPLLNGPGFCDSRGVGLHALIAHARRTHKFRGKSASLSTPWEGLTDRQRTWYLERRDLEVRRRENNGNYTAEDEALSRRFQEEKFPDA